MVDNKSHEVMTEPDLGGADRTGDAVAAGEPAASRPETDESAAAPAAANKDPVIPPLPPKPAGTGRALFAGAIGGAVVAALAAAAMTQLAPGVQLSRVDLDRIAAAEAAAERDAGAMASLDKRLAALEQAAGGLAGIDKRIAALEAADAADASKLAAGTQAVQAVQAVSADVKSLRADVDAARAEIAPLAARLDKLEKAAAAAPDLAALPGRVQKLEAEAAAPKPASTSGSSAAVAVVAETIRDKLASGAPYATELTALASLGVDPAQLAALKPLAGGAPTDGALAASFEAAEPNLFAAVAPKETGSVADRMLAHLRGLVQVRPVGEVGGDDPQALSSQVLADLRRGDLGRALAAFGKLPAPAREAAAGFAAQAKGKQDAGDAAQAIRDAAVARLAEAKS